MNQITVTGMVISATPIGEYDRRVVILTKERGKIAAFARGARRPNSALLGMTSPFSFGEFVVYEGRTSYTLVSASISNYFSELRMDVEGAYYGFYFLELANYYTREANDETMTLKLLYQTLRALVNPKIPNKLIRYIFELKTLVVNGECPSDFEELDICGSTRYTLQYIAASPLEKLYTFTVSDEVLSELCEAMDRFLAKHVGHKMKSEEMLEVF